MRNRKRKMPTKSIMEIAIEVCAPHDIDVEKVRFSTCQHQEFLWIRAKIAAAAKAEGWGTPAIGRFLNRDHSTISSYLAKEPA